MAYFKNYILTLPKANLPPSIKALFYHLQSWDSHWSEGQAEPQRQIMYMYMYVYVYVYIYIYIYFYFSSIWLVWVWEGAQHFTFHTLGVHHLQH